MTELARSSAQELGEVTPTADSEEGSGSSDSRPKTTFGPEDRRLALVTFVATLAANVATLAVAGVALLAYHLGPRLASGGSWVGGLALGWIALAAVAHRVFDRSFFAGKKIGRLGGIIGILYFCGVALGFVFLSFFVLGKLISVK